jgi:hypothetical protein
VTLHFGNIPAHELAPYLADDSLHARVVAIAFDAHCVALRVAREGRLGELCRPSDRVPHITLGCAPGVPHKYANEMLQGGAHQEVACEFELMLTVNPVVLPQR